MKPGHALVFFGSWLVFFFFFNFHVDIQSTRNMMSGYVYASLIEELVHPTHTHTHTHTHTNGSKTSLSTALDVFSFYPNSVEVNLNFFFLVTLKVCVTSDFARAEFMSWHAPVTQKPENMTQSLCHYRYFHVYSSRGSGSAPDSVLQSFMALSSSMFCFVLIDCV